MNRASDSQRPTYREFDARVRAYIADVQFALEQPKWRGDQAYVDDVNAAIDRLRTAVARLPDTRDEAESVLAADLAHDAGNVCYLANIASPDSGLSLESRARKLSSAECSAAIRLSVMTAILPVQPAFVNAREFVGLAAEAFAGRAAGAHVAIRRIPEGENVRAASSYLLPFAKECARNAAKHGVEGTQRLEIFVDGNFELVIRFSNVIAKGATAPGSRRGQEINAKFAKLLGGRYVSERREPWRPGPAEWVVELAFPMSW